MGYRWWEVKYWFRRRCEGVVTWVAFRLPRELAYWCVVRVWSEASKKMPNAEVPGIAIKDALDCWRGTMGK